jgi:integrase
MMTAKRLNHFPAPGCAVSSVVEHYLDTVMSGNEQTVELQSSAERVLLPPEFRSDYRPRRRGRSRLLVRIARGLYRYGPNGIIYWCRKINGKNVWKSLQTADQRRAMAVTAMHNYLSGQNGTTEFTGLPDGTTTPSAYPLPGWLAGGSVESPPINPKNNSLPVAAAPVETSPEIAPQPPANHGLVTATVSLNDLVKRYKAQWKNLASGTRAKLSCHFIVAARYLNFDRDVKTLKLADLRELKSKLSDGRKPASVNDIIFKGLGALFKIAQEDEIIDRSPLERLARARRGETDRQQPTWDEAQLIEAEVGRHARESSVIVGFMRNFGVGQAEIRYLTGDSVDCERGMIHFRRKKTGKPFDVPIFAHAKAFVEKLREAGRLQVGRPVVQWRNPRKSLATACERLGMPEYEPRALRRSFIVHCLQQGIDPRVVAKWQGHADAKLIFSVYGKFIDQAYERAQADKLGVGNLMPGSKPGQAVAQTTTTLATS